MTWFLCDVDGTLLQDGKVSAEDEAAIRKWKRKGNAFGLVTGRDEVYCERLMDHAGAQADFLICDNGAKVVIQGRVLQDLRIDGGRLRQVVKELAAYCDRLVLMVTDAQGMRRFPISRFGMDNVLRGMKQESHLEGFSFEDLEAVMDQGTPKVTLIVFEDVNTQALFEEIKHVGGLNWNITAEHYIEASLSDKGAALDLFLANVPADDCVFAGDGINDLPVFRRLGRTYCMSHAPVLVRQEAAACADTVCEVLEREMNVQKT